MRGRCRAITTLGAVHGTVLAPAHVEPEVEVRGCRMIGGCRGCVPVSDWLNSVVLQQILR
jgi:hypothetical protein